MMYLVFKKSVIRLIIYKTELNESEKINYLSTYQSPSVCHKSKYKYEIKLGATYILFDEYFNVKIVCSNINFIKP